jgi:glycosidase
MTGGHDPDNRKDFLGGWREDSVNKSLKEGRTADEQEMFEHTRTWIEIRRKSNALRNGKTIDLTYGDDVYGFARQSPNEIVVVGVNRSGETKYVEFRESVLNLKSAKAIYIPNGTASAKNIGNQSAANGAVRLPVPARNVVVYTVATNGR